MKANKIKDNFSKYIDESGLNDIFVYISRRILVERPDDAFKFAADILRRKAIETSALVHLVEASLPDNDVTKPHPYPL